MELTLEQIRAMGKQEQITMHNCIQGWSGIAQWGGLQLAKLIELVRPLPEAKVVVFYSFGEGIYGGTYHDSHFDAERPAPAEPAGLRDER